MIMGGEDIQLRRGNAVVTVEGAGWSHPLEAAASRIRRE